MPTKDKILSLLRKQTLNVAQLAQILDITRNAVIVPLRQLEAENLVTTVEQRDRRVGKPALYYTATKGHEDEASQAYPAFAAALVGALPDYLTPDQLNDVMAQVGQVLSRNLTLSETTSKRERLRAAVDFVNVLGADPTLESTPGGTLLSSHSCPLAQAVRKEPCVCSVVSNFFETVVGVEVKECCDRGEKLHCRFAIPVSLDAHDYANRGEGPNL